MSANTDLKDALAVARSNVPANTNGSQAPVLPSDGGQQRAVQGLPDIVDKTSAGQAGQVPQEQQQAQTEQAEQPTTVPVAVVQDERKKRQEAENFAREQQERSSNLEATVGQLQQELATAIGQINSIQNQNGQQQVQQAGQEEYVPEFLDDPDAWANWLVDKTRQEAYQIMVNVGRDIYNQRLGYFNDIYSGRAPVPTPVGPERVAEATNAVVRAGLGEEAQKHFDPTGWALHWYDQQQGIKHFQASPDGRLDPKAYNERLVNQLFQNDNFWQEAIRQPAVQNALVNATRNQDGQVAQPGYQQQAPQPGQQYQPQQVPNLPQSMAHQPGSANANVVPLPPANSSLKDALNTRQARTGMSLG